MKNREIFVLYTFDYNFGIQQTLSTACYPENTNAGPTSHQRCLNVCCLLGHPAGSTWQWREMEETGDWCSSIIDTSQGAGCKHIKHLSAYCPARRQSLNNHYVITSWQICTAAKKTKGSNCLLFKQAVTAFWFSGHYTCTFITHDLLGQVTGAGPALYHRWASISYLLFLSGITHNPDWLAAEGKQFDSDCIWMSYIKNAFIHCNYNCVIT